MRYARSLSRVLGIVFIATFSLNIALAQYFPLYKLYEPVEKGNYEEVKRLFLQFSNEISEVLQLSNESSEEYFKKYFKERFRRDATLKRVLRVAVENGYSEIVKIFLDKGADPNYKDEIGNTLLHYAAVGGNIEIVKILLNKGADRNLKNKFGKKPLTYSRNNEIASILGKDDFMIKSEKVFTNNRIKITKTFDYSELWPEDVSVLFVGELHGIPEFRAEVVRLIKNFKKSGVRLTHYATEFITKREQSVIEVYQYTPLPREKFKIKKGKPYSTVDKTAKESGVKIIGLDIGDISWGWGTSAKGIMERNKQWVNILMGILTEHPKKSPRPKILVYCGKGHSMYRDSYYLKPVSTKLQEQGIKVKVIELVGSFKKGRWDVYSRTAERLGIQNEHFVVFVPKNKAQLLGADFIINVPEPDTIPEELLRPITSPFIDYKNK